MRIRQLFYTSCKKGLSSGMGFQTYSMSKKITDEERMEIEKHCVYIPPDNLPTQPTDEEINRLFPISFSSFKLQNDKYCVCRAKYIGKDYSGRYGNYFCHVLISDEPWPFYPIELYESEVFKSGLSFEEENILEVEYLPELENVPLGNIVNFYNISSFLKESQKDKKRKAFGQLMESAINYSRNKKRILFCDDKYSIPFWIGALQMALPKKLAQQFSFTTYCYNPENVNYIICAVDENKLNFGDIQKSHRYCTFNFNQSCNSEGSCSSSFVKLAEIGYTVSKEVFLPFVDFLCQFEYNKLDENIDSCVSLYNIVKKGLEKSDIPNVKRALSFATEYKSIDAYRQLFQLLNPNLEKISTQVDLELAGMMTRFLLKVGREINNSENIRKAYEFFFDSIHYLIVDVEEVSSDGILELYEEIRNMQKVNVEEFIRASLNPSRIKELNTYLEGCKIRHAKFYFRSIVGDIVAFNNKCTKSQKKVLFNATLEEDKVVTMLLNNCIKILVTSKEDVLDILNYFRDEYEYFSKIILRIYHINKYSYKDSEVEELLVGFIIDYCNENKEWKRKIYSEINKLNGSSDFLFSIYDFELKRDNNKDFFINYCYETFYILQNYSNKKFSDALSLYLDIRDKEQISIEEYKKIIDYMDKTNISKIIDKLVLKKLFTYSEEQINIENSAAEEDFIEKIKKMKEDYDIETSCSRAEILYVGRKIQSPDIRNRVALLQDLRVNFSNMNTNEYEKYLRWFLSNICAYVKDSRDHDKVKKALFCPSYWNVFYNVYMDTLDDILFTRKYRQILKANNKEGYEIVLDFIILTFKDMRDENQEIEELINTRIIEVLTKFNEKKLKNYEYYFISRIANLNNKMDITIKWREIIRKTKEKSKKKNILSFFKK